MESSLTTLNTKVLTLGIAGLVTSLSAGVTAADSTAVSPWGFDPPAGWVAPSLDPRGVQLETRQLATGVYALLSNKPPVDNSGFVVGERGVLVIDAHFNGDMARQIQEAVRAVTDKPILYLVNTNYHGDHTFGNYAFPAETTIIAHKKTARAMQDFEQEKKIMLATVGGDKTIFGDATLRLPDVEFEDNLRIDLGKRVVELYNFGHGNTAGDTVVYVPEAKVAWTGNLVLGTDTIPWGIEGDLQAYLQTITRFATTLDVETIVPGHVLTTDGRVSVHVPRIPQRPADCRP